MCFILKKDKQKALELVKQKINGEIKITYNEISKQTGYSSRLTKSPIDERIIQSNNNEYVMTDLKVAVKNELNSAPKQQNGSISRKDANKVLQNTR